MRVRLPRMNDEAARIVQRLRLAPLPHEGGIFSRTWTAPSRDFPSARDWILALTR